MRYLKYGIILLLGLGVLTLALANRDPVMLQVLPADMAEFLGVNYSIELPLFLVILGGVVIGLVIGFIWEWVREYRHRAEAARARREAERLEDELDRTRAKAAADPASDDEQLLAMIEDRKPG